MIPKHKKVSWIKCLLMWVRSLMVELTITNSNNIMFKKLKLDMVSNCTTQLNSVRRLSQTSFPSSPTCRSTDFELVSCGNQICSLNRIHLARLKTQNLAVEKERDQLRCTIEDERNKLTRRIQSIDEMVNAVVEKEKNILRRERGLKKRQTLLDTEEQRIGSMVQQHFHIEQAVRDMETQLKLLKNQLASLQNTEKSSVLRINQLEHRICELQMTERTVKEGLDVLQKQEVQHLYTIKSLQEFIENSQQHFLNLQDIEKRLSIISQLKLADKCHQLNLLQPNMLAKLEDHSQFQEQVQMRTQALSLNEAALKRKMDSDTERYKRRFMTQENVSSVSPDLDSRQIEQKTIRIQSFNDK